MSAAIRFNLYLEELVRGGELDMEEGCGSDDQGQDEGEDEDEGDVVVYYEPEQEEEQEAQVEVEEVEMVDIGVERPPLFRGPFIPGERFHLLLMDDNEAKEQLRFYRNDIIDIVTALRLPDLIITQSRDKVWSVEALCLVLYRFSSPSKLSRMSSVFHRSRSTISRVINCTLFWIMEHWHKLLDWDIHRLTPAKLEEYAHWCNLKTRGFCSNVFGFIDGTCRPICRPSVGQEGQYNGRKKQHTLNYQGVVATDGVLIHLSEAFDGTHNNVEMFTLTEMGRLLEEHAYDTQGRSLAIYGDSAYQLGAHVIVKHDEHPAVPDHEVQYNNAMNAQRTSIEWAFGEITRYFNALNYRRQQQLLKSPVEYHYRTMAIITNIRTCIYGNQISTHFRSIPPTLNEYLNDAVFTAI